MPVRRPGLMRSRYRSGSLWAHEDGLRSWAECKRSCPKSSAASPISLALRTILALGLTGSNPGQGFAVRRLASILEKVKLQAEGQARVPSSWANP